MRGGSSFASICSGDQPRRHRSQTMNQYAAMAERHWRRWLPSRVAAMDDPSSFFSELGEEAAAQIEDLTADLAGGDPPGETDMAWAGRWWLPGTGWARRPRATEGDGGAPPSR